MNTVRIARVAVLVLAALVAGAAAAQALPNIVILATGGTIAGAQPKEGDPGYKSGSLSVESLIAAGPAWTRSRGSPASRSRRSAVRT